MKRIKVLRIIARLNIGGPAIHTILLTEGLDRSKFETILVVGTVDKSEGDMSYLAEQKEIYPLIIPELTPSLNICNDIIAFWKIFCLIKRERPDIVHTHTAKAGALGRLAGMLYNLISRVSSLLSGEKKRPVLIHTFHGHVLHSYFGRIRSALFLWIEKFLAIFTARIIAVSENLKEELISLKVASSEKIVTVPLGLELQRYLNLNTDSSCKVRDYSSVGIIGRLVPIKNHRMFLDAAKKLIDGFGLKQKTKFLIVGDGPLRQKLESYAEGLDIKENVIFTGWIKDLTRIYSELDIVALTSLNEGTPVALIEAQAAARPCIATRVGGVADVVEDGISGFLVPSQDIDKFIKCIIKLLNNPDLRQTMGKCGRDRVKNRFDKSQLLKSIEALYRLCLQAGEK